MRINAEFDERVVVHSEQLDWLDSPMPGVQRRPLDRVGDEIARATSIVRYAPGSHFSPHVHTGGEEFLVLDGVFQDEHGDFPAGSYLRNPPTSRHTPGAEAGCTIFVKLWQFAPDDRQHVRTTLDELQLSAESHHPGVSSALLYSDSLETVKLVEMLPATTLTDDSLDGFEMLVLDGTVVEEDDTLGPRSWLRLPVGQPLGIAAGQQGARIWLKSGHLRAVQAQIERVSEN